MKKLLMTSVTAATTGAFMATGAAHAADLPAYVPPPPAPVWTWTGPYAGLHVGTLDGDVEARDDGEDTFFGDTFFGNKFGSGDAFDPNGVLGGIQAGYNFQFDSIVLGIEGDVSFGDIDDVVYPLDIWAEAEMDWMATIRARIGWAWDRTLFYATGGAAFTDLKVKFDFGPNGSDSDRNSYFGWTVGGGVEHAVTDNISLKAEYLYADFGKERFDFFSGEFEDDYKLTTHTFRVGVNWLF